MPGLPAQGNRHSVVTSAELTRPNVLAISSLFPNQAAPDYGIFVANRLAALRSHANISVINPIAWSPAHKMLSKYRHLSSVPRRDNISMLDVFHKRFLSVPGMLKGIEAMSCQRSIWPLAAEMHKKTGFDLVDVHWTYPDLPVGIHLARQFNVKAMITVRGIEAFYQAGSPRREKIVRRSISMADRIIALSQQIKDRCDEITGDPARSFVIRNGVNSSRFRYCPMSSARQALGLPEEAKILFSVGGLVYGKGFDVLIRAIAKLHSARFPGDLRLYIAGQGGPAGNYRSQLVRMIEAFELHDVVTLVGQVPNSELPMWYNAADLFCFASRSEGSPNVITEALASGCPCIATNVGTVPDILAAEVNPSICVAPDDVDAFVDGIPGMLTRVLDREKLAHRYAKYDWSWCAEQVARHYRALAFN